jgi:uncharacterized protein YeaO (DUF488 family)
MGIRVVRVRDVRPEDAGARYLVDRLWPRGMTKASLGLTAWLRDVAPSDELRRWFGHDPERWSEFRDRYRAELDAHPGAWRPVRDAADDGDVLLLYAAADPEHNNAVVLAEYLAEQSGGGPPG